MSVDEVNAGGVTQLLYSYLAKSRNTPSRFMLPKLETSANPIGQATKLDFTQFAYSKESIRGEVDFTELAVLELNRVSQWSIPTNVNSPRSNENSRQKHVTDLNLRGKKHLIAMLLTYLQYSITLGRRSKALDFLYISASEILTVQYKNWKYAESRAPMFFKIRVLSTRFTSETKSMTPKLFLQF